MFDVITEPPYTPVRPTTNIRFTSIRLYPFPHSFPSTPATLKAQNWYELDLEKY